MGAFLLTPGSPESFVRRPTWGPANIVNVAFDRPRARGQRNGPEPVSTQPDNGSVRGFLHLHLHLHRHLHLHLHLQHQIAHPILCKFNASNRLHDLLSEPSPAGCSIKDVGERTHLHKLQRTHTSTYLIAPEIAGAAALSVHRSTIDRDRRTGKTAQPCRTTWLALAL